MRTVFHVRFKRTFSSTLTHSGRRTLTSSLNMKAIVPVEGGEALLISHFEADRERIYSWCLADASGHCIYRFNSVAMF